MLAASLPPTTSPGASPFLLKAHDVETLAQSDGFMILRDHLAQHYTYEYVCQAQAVKECSG